MLAINRLAGDKLGDHYETDASGASRLLTSGVQINIADGQITGRVYLQDGGYYDEVYERVGPGTWRVIQSTLVP